MTRVGVMLPTFSSDPGPALATARAAEIGGLDGVFAFDHLWPMGNPGRPALWSFGILGAVVARTERIVVGPLVARIDLLPEDELVRTFAGLAMMAGTDRVIAALGAGDNLSAGENVSYGLRRAPVAERLAMLTRVADRLRAHGIVTWMGGNSEAVAGLAVTHADAHNVWGLTVEEIASRGAHPGHVPMTWGGQVLIGRDQDELESLRATYGPRPGLVSGTVDDVALHLRGLGVTWTVCAPLDYIADPVRSTETVCLVREAVQ